MHMPANPFALDSTYFGGLGLASFSIFLKKVQFLPKINIYKDT